MSLVMQISFMKERERVMHLSERVRYMVRFYLPAQTVVRALSGRTSLLVVGT